jgi:hypothetical protein
VALAATTFAIKLDLDRDGTYETDAVLDVDQFTGGLQTWRGMGDDGIYQTSRLELRLDDADGDWSPAYTSSPHNGNLGEDVPIQLIATHSAVPYTFWTGFVQRWIHDSERGYNAVVTLECADLTKYLIDSEPVNLSVSKVRDTDAAVQAVLEAIGLTAASWTLDDGVQDLAYSYAIGQTAMDAIVGFAKAEMTAQVWVTGDGKLRFEARNSRLGLTVDDTWGDGTSVTPSRVSYVLNDADIMSEAHVRGVRHIDGETGEEVFRFAPEWLNPGAQSLIIPAGETYKRRFKLTAPVLAINEAEADNDYSGNDAADASGTDRTADLATTYTLIGSGEVDVEITNNHTGGVYVTHLRVRGQETAFYADRPEARYSFPIPGRKAGSGKPIDIPWVDGDSSKLLDLAVQLTHTYRPAWPLIELEFGWDDDAIATAMLGAELGDLVLFKDQTGGPWTTGIEEWIYVQSIAHEFVPGEPFRSIVKGVPSYLYRNLDAIAHDQFNRANSTGDLGVSASGHTWAGDGSMDIVSNKARGAADGELLPRLDCTVTDHIVEVTVDGFTTGDECGVFGRWQNDSNFYLLYLTNNSQKWNLYRKLAGAYGEIASGAMTVAGPHEVKLMIQGTRLRAYVDGAEVASETDASLASGTQGGPYVFNANGSVTFDNFYIQGLN